MTKRYIVVIYSSPTGWKAPGVFDRLKREWLMFYKELSEAEEGAATLNVERR